MDSIQKAEQNQIINSVNAGAFSDCFETLKIGNLLKQVGIKKSISGKMRIGKDAVDSFF
jgi:hypothetical protein